jgi:KDO2-lipid IV(A) lauroyltransferase
LKEVSQLLEYLTLKLTVSGIQRLDRKRAFSIAGKLGSVLYNIPRVRGVCEENLRFTGFPEEIGRESFKNFLKASVDFFRMSKYSEEEIKNLFLPVDPSVVPEEGGFLLTAHIGNWEIMGALFSILSKGKLSVVAKPMKNKRVDKLINGIRRRFGIRVIPTGKGIEIFKEIKRGNYVGVLLDPVSYTHLTLPTIA